MLRTLKWVVFAFAAIGVLMILGVGTYLWGEHNREVELPNPSGKYAVGRVSFDWVDQNRPETFTTQSDDQRELSGWIWYPAEVRGEEPAAYLPDEWRNGRQKIAGMLGMFFVQNFAQVHSHAVADATLASDEAS